MVWVILLIIVITIKTINDKVDRYFNELATLISDVEHEFNERWEKENET